MFETITFEEFKTLMTKAVAIQGCELPKIKALTQENCLCSLQSLHSYSHQLDGMALFRTLHTKQGDVYQHIKQHTDRL